MLVDHREIAFESAIEQSLVTAGGYSHADPRSFDKERCLDPTVLVPFLQETQPAEWSALEKLHGVRTEQIVLDDLCKALDSQGALPVIRHGFKCFGKSFRVAFFAPATRMNLETERRYRANRLTITRQLQYNPYTTKSLDLTLSLNGLPVATAELKNPLTRQTVKDAIQQYRLDRDPRELIFQFKKRTLVHFAVDPDEVYMTTRLAGEQTFFLPFNKGNGLGAGNPEKLHAQLYAVIDPAIGRFLELPEEDQDEYRRQLTAFRNLYSFLSQVIPFQDTDLEKLYAFVRFFLMKLPRGDSGPRYDFEDEITLKYYRLQKISEGRIELQPGQEVPVKGPTEVGTGKSHDEQVELSSLIDQINERFGTDFTKRDELFFQQIKQDAVNDEKIRQTAEANTLRNFGYVFDKAFVDFVISRLDRNQDVGEKVLSNEELRKFLTERMRREVYDAVRQSLPADAGG